MNLLQVASVLLAVYGIGGLAVSIASQESRHVMPWKVYNHSYVKISYKVNDIPLNLPEYLTSLTIINSNITHIKASSFSRFKQLKTLEISQNSFGMIESRPFLDLMNLENLILSCSSRTVDSAGNPNISYPVIPSDMLYGLESLTSLKLMIMGIKTLYKDFFQYTRNLRVLVLRRNPIQTIKSDAFDYLDKLEILDLTYIYITNLYPDTFRMLKNLKELYLAPTRLTAIPCDALSKLDSLRVLDIGGSFSSVYFEESMKELGHLETVTLYDVYTKNIFEYIHPNFTFIEPGAFEHLLTQSLIVDENQIYVSFGANYSNLFSPSLRSLSCSGISSPITEQIISELYVITFLPPKLRDINLSSNKLKEIKEESFKMVPELRTLNLSANAFHTLDRYSFWGLQKLEILDLSKNQLDSTSIQALRVFAEPEYNLRILNISGNTPLAGNIAPKKMETIFNIASLRELSLQTMKLRIRDTLIELSVCNIPNLEVLHLRNNYLYKFTPKCLERLKSLKVADLSYNRLNPSSVIDFNLSQLPNLEYINLSGSRFDLGLLKGAVSIRILVLINGKSTDPRHHWDDSFNTLWERSQLKFPNLTIFVMTYSQVSFLSQQVYSGIQNAEMLILNKNKFTFLDMSVFQNHTKLRSIDMRGNPIVRVNGSSWHLPKLHTLILSGTLLTSVPEFLFSKQFLPSLQILDLGKNSFNCDCQLSLFRKWAQEDRLIQVVDFNSYQCSRSDNKRKDLMYVRDFDPWQLECESLLHVYLSVGLACTVAVLASVVGLCVYNRWYIKYACFVVKLKVRGYHELIDLEEKEKPFDAFVSYNSVDGDWISSQLLPHLESGDPPKFKICVDFKNFIPGRYIVDNIIDSIQESRKTILVLTPNFVKSEWCFFEMEMALNRLFEESRDVLILVLLEPIPDKDLPRKLRKLFTKKTYIEWPKEDCHTARQLFWVKMEDALKIPSKVDHVHKL
ncbi:uncharacterized protein LOC144433914 [Glandiceps talaboti]